MQYDTKKMILAIYKENAERLGLTLTEYFLYLLVLIFID